ncbi:MAG: competence/damage-inducible protein A [Anaerolineae bacterium]|jgi:nicotinamide-nucleotide amidase|nr:competence/damage-inducible protein A [Anaerolineae bacterium]MBT7069577.1 competence/damage-inducible protein A [Anaerolineae bacterium]MBT7325839.1 competence/damage-inducible protein A [Anaerolineae bacterium]
MPRAEIITIGTEILLGEIVDTNTRYIARNLRDLGVDLYRTITIGDNVERIAETIRESLHRSEIVITTGGLGPTVDDPTRDAVALATGLQSEFREELWEQISKRVSLYGRTPSENQKRQAYVPQGSIALENPVGTAPCFIVETERSAVISLPGVPREMETILHDSVIPYLQKRYGFDEIIKVRLLHTSGIGEGDLDEKIGDLELLRNPTVGLAAHTGVVDIRLAAKAKTEAEANAMLAEVENEIRQRLGKIIFGTDQDTLAGAMLAALEKRGWKLVTLESGLDGRLSRQLKKEAHPNLLIAEDRLFAPKELLPALQKLKSEQGADAALGVAFFPSDETQTAELVLLTPETEKARTLRYGGHPKNALRWAPNIAINILRRAVI